MKKEKWSLVKDFPDYLISDKGNLKTLKTLEDRKPHIKEDGYVFIPLSSKEGQKIKYIHRLVAEAFVANPLNKEQVNHKNGIKSDNRASNLEWVTPKENIQHAIETGLLKYKNKEDKIKKSNGSKLNPEKVIEIRVLWETGEYKKVQLAKMFGVSESTIRDVITKRQWRNV